ncbi:MAG: hypothetical protein NZL93_06065, partial [Chthoniobacterales bacterium]|nr:hypothetical protein [Chthoniobacterales bacterium]
FVAYLQFGFLHSFFVEGGKVLSCQLSFAFKRLVCYCFVILRSVFERDDVYRNVLSTLRSKCEWDLPAAR